MGMENSPQLQRMLDLCVKEEPTFKLRFKSETWWWKALYYTVIWVFNRRFMTHYATTVGTTVYLPDRAYLESKGSQLVGLLAHELVHMRDRREMGKVTYFLKYSSPQIFAALALLSVFAVWSLPMLVFLLFLLLALPIPSPGRKELELNGYTMSLAVQYWKDGSVHPAYISEYAKYFINSEYFFMWPFRKSIEDALRARLRQIESGEILKIPLYAKVHDLL